MRPTPANARPSGMVAASSVRVRQYDTRKEANSGSRSACRHDPPAAHHVIPTPITGGPCHVIPTPITGGPCHVIPTPITGGPCHVIPTPITGGPCHVIPTPITGGPCHVIPTPITSFPHPSHVIPAPITRHSHPHHTPLPHPSHATPTPITRHSHTHHTPFPHPSRHSREGGNPAACVRRRIHGNTDTVVLVCLGRQDMVAAEAMDNPRDLAKAGGICNDHE